MVTKMLKPNLSKWKQTTGDLFASAMQAEHPRTRERFLLLYLTATQERGATRGATELGRNPRTAMRWVRRYNEKGPDVLVFKRTGGRPPLCPRRRLQESGRC